MATEQQSPIGRAAAWATGGLFLGGVCAPLALWLATGEWDQSALSEFREPAPPPALSLEPEVLAAAPAQAADWFADSFPGRQLLMRAHNAALWFGLRIAVGDEMARGDDDWLFLRGESSFAIHRGDLLEPEALEVWIERHRAWRDWLAARDVRFAFCIAAEKQSIYDDRVPDWMGPVAERTRTDQFVEGLRAIGIPVADTRQALREQAREELVYYPLGTHWNDAGAYVAYRLILEALDDPSLGPPVPLEGFERVDKSTLDEAWYGDSWLSRMHIADLVRQPDNNLIPKAPGYQPFAVWPAAAGGMDGVVVGTLATQPKLILLRDSFGKWVWPFLAPHCSQLVSESFRRFDPELVEFVLPDHVLHLRVERLLGNRPPKLPLAPAEIEVARAWNRGRPLTVAGQRVEDQRAEDDGATQIWLRGTRAQPTIQAQAKREDWPRLDKAQARFRLVGSDGAQTEVVLRFQPDRRTAFVGPVTTRLPARLEPLGSPAGSLELAARRVGD